MTSYIRSLRNLQQNQYVDKIYVTNICTQNPWKFSKWNPLTILNMFKNLFRKLQTKIARLYSAQLAS